MECTPESLISTKPVIFETSDLNALMKQIPPGILMKARSRQDRRKSAVWRENNADGGLILQRW